MNDKHVLKIGGSLLFDEKNELRAGAIKEFVDFLTHNAAKLSVVVIGGGRIARAYGKALASIHPNQALQDILGIKVSRLNAFLLASITGPGVSYQGVPGSIEELARVKSLFPDKVVFMGGLEVGQSTTSVACEAAEVLGCPLLVATDVDGIFDKDPGKHPDAKKRDEVTTSQLREILSLGTADNQKAGEYRILDNVSFGIIERSSIRLRIVKGDPFVLQEALDGKDIGTRVLSFCK